MGKLFLDEDNLQAAGVHIQNIATLRKLTAFVEAQEAIAAAQDDITDLETGKQDADATLTALSLFNTNGLVTQTAHDTFTGRSIAAGTGISVTNGSGVAGNPTIASTITQYTDEMARDALGAALVAGTNVTITVDDPGNTITIAASGGGGSLSDGDYGDITVGGSGTTLTIDSDAVTYAKIQNVSAASKLLGRGDSGSGDVQEITLGSGLTMTGTTLSASGGGGGATLKARAYRNTAVNTTSAGWQQIILDATTYDPSSIYNTTTGRFTPTTAGYYLVNSRFRSNTAGTIALGIGKNGTQVMALGPDANMNATSGSALIYCNGTTDYLDQRIFANAVRAVTTGDFDTWMEIVGPIIT